MKQQRLTEIPVASIARIDCAWCGVVVQPGTEPARSGQCAGCYGHMLSRVRPIVVLVTGARDYRNLARVESALMRFIGGHPVTLLHGDCDAGGADKMAGEVATRFGWRVRTFPADWKKHGRAAGPIRNRQMLDERPDLVVAFHDNLDKSKGTRDCVTQAERRRVPVWPINSVVRPMEAR